MLTFPATTARLLPGWMLNVAQLIHGDEALLMAGFIFVVHFFNVAFRVDRFPLDPVMFSGRITEARMRQERTWQYLRLANERRLDELVVHDEWERWKPVASTLGMLALAIGLLLMAAIFVGVVTLLWDAVAGG